MLMGYIRCSASNLAFYGMFMECSWGCSACQAVFHVGRPKYVQRELEKYTGERKMNPHVSAYRSPQIPWIVDFLNALAYR